MRAGWKERDPGFGGGGPGPGGGADLQLAMPPLTPDVRKLVIANAVVFLASFFLSFFPGEAGWVFLRDGFGLNPPLWADWFPFLPVWQLVSWGFLHSVDDPFHILRNMLFLYFLGTMLEEIVGGRRFFVAYVGALLFSGLVTLVTGLVSGTPWPTIGASGAVLAVVVATAVLRPDTRVIFILFPITLKTLALVYVGLDLFSALASLRGDVVSNVSNVAHLSGAAFGFVLVKKGWIWRDPVEALQARRAERDAEREAADTERLDEVLEKINRDGIHSLSSAERAFLKRVSKRG